MKSMRIGMSVLLLILLSSCSVGEVVEEAKNKDTIRITQTVKGENNYARTKDISDEERIAQVRDIFEKATWEKMPDGDRSAPDYKIETYDVWASDDADYAEAQDVNSEKYTKITGEDFEVIIQLVIDAFH